MVEAVGKTIRLMSNETKPETNAPETNVETTVVSNNEKPEAEGKLLLGKKVLRHFGVQSDVQAGSFSVRIRCF